jgi:preprotein translocase subunit SecE
VSKTADNVISHAEDDGKRSGSGKSALANARQFLHDTRSEMKRVSWPSANDVKNTTIIVVVNVIFFAIFLFLVDHGWGYIINGLNWLAKKAFGIS